MAKSGAMKGFLFTLGFLCTIFAATNGYSQYQELIPNGDLVPHPCKPNYLWKGVGHLNVLGGGARNPFGHDFTRYGKTWNKVLCEKDSDGDGRTNGEELGDPRCEWTPDGGAPSAPASGHPGVCEPTESELCKANNAAVKEDWEFCQQGELKCDAVHEPDIKNFTISIDSGTKVPAQETTYMCQLVKLPDDQEYHIIGSIPKIDNLQVAHHIIIYGCDENALATLSHYSSPQICDGMAISSVCQHNIRGWTVGEDGFCEKPNVGTRIGKNVFNYAIIEIHWNNPMEVPNYTDGSGLTIFYTENLRKYDRGRLVVGQNGLAIPPNVDAHYESAVCTSDCTKELNKPIYIYSVLLHMHYLGRAGRVEQWRNGSLLQVLVDSTEYSYDSPISYPIDPPIKLMAGDELKMFCKFKSKSKDKITYFGDATSDEMCLAFFAYYPNSHFRFCAAFGALDVCYNRERDLMTQRREFLKTMDCDEAQSQTIVQKIATTASQLCGTIARPVCTTECKEFLQKVYQEEPCLKNGLRFLFEMGIGRSNRPESKPMLRLLRVCDDEIILVKSEVQYYEKFALMKPMGTGTTGTGETPRNTETGGTAGSAAMITSGFICIIIMAILTFFW